MQTGAGLHEAEAVIERAPDDVVLEHLDAKRTLEGDGVIHHRPAQALSLPSGRKEQARLMAQQRGEPDGGSVDLCQPGFGIGKIDGAHVMGDLRDDFGRQKGVRQHVRTAPDGGRRDILPKPLGATHGRSSHNAKNQTPVCRITTPTVFLISVTSTTIDISRA
jgi:hypothetical protein